MGYAAAIAFSALLCGAAGAGAAERETTRHFLIEVRGSGPADLAGVIEEAGGVLVHPLPEIGAASAISSDPRFARALGRVKGIGRVHLDRNVQWLPEEGGLDVAHAPSESGHVASPPRGIFQPCQWHIDQIDAPGAWAQGHFGAGATVAVLDSGVSGDPAFGGGLPHDDMVGQLVGNVTMVSEDEPTFCVPGGAFDSTSPLDFRFHGTFVAAEIVARGVLVAGVAPDAKILGVKVLNCLGEGTFGDLIAGILFAAEQPQVDVIHMSLSGTLRKNEPGAGRLVGALHKAVNFAAGVKGKLVVSSAGNNAVDLDHDGNQVVLPAQAGTGIAAWAGDVNGDLASYSNHGRSGTWVGAGGGDETAESPFIPFADCPLHPSREDGVLSVCSPDSIIFPSCRFGRSLVFNASGTSFSAPLVSGVAALAVGAHGPMNGARLEALLAKTADDLGKKGTDNLFSHGRVNASHAVRAP